MKSMREIRNRISAEIADMSYSELSRWLDRQVREDPFFSHIPKSRKPGQGPHGEDWCGTWLGTLSDADQSTARGRYVIPDFQREFKWESKDIREFMRSIFLDYHIGQSAP